MSDGSVTIDTQLDDSGAEKGLGTLNSTLGKIGNGIATTFKIGATAIAGVSAAFTGLVVASVNARGELEQQIGGIETLFTNELGSASETVIKNANNAYKTAGMSAIEYMSTATSFSASLLQSLGNDTKKAAEVTDMAIVDMSDNANKMGTSMELIQNAYQGFAKQNYTMLDNLKLGYGGTKEEMERLLADAQKITGVKYDIKNLSDVYNAIHVIQGELGITGTTAKEASETLQGSFASMKGAWNNFLSGSGNLSQVVDTAKDVVKNIVRIVNEAIPDIMDSITEALPELLELGGEILQQFIEGMVTNLPQLMTTAGQILNRLIQGILANLPQLFPVAIQIIQQLIAGLISYLPQIVQMGITLIMQLILGISQMLPELIPQAINCILTLVEGLLDNIDLLVDASIQLVMGLADGIINAVPVLLEKAPVIIEKLLNALIENVPKMHKAAQELIFKLASSIISFLPKIVEAAGQIINKIWNVLKELPQLAMQWGKDMIQGFINGIKNMLNNLAEAAKNVGQKIKEFLHFSRPDKGPLRDYEKWMPDMISGLTKTLKQSSPKLYNSAKEIAQKISDNFDLTSLYNKMQTAVAIESGKIATNLSTLTSMNKILTANITLNPSDIYMDSIKVGRMVTPTVSRTIKAGGI